MVHGLAAGVDQGHLEGTGGDGSGGREPGTRREPEGPGWLADARRLARFVLLDQARLDEAVGDVADGGARDACHLRQLGP